MPSKIRNLAFREPAGQPAVAVMVSGALIFFGLYVYFGVLGHTSTIYDLFIAGSFALSGVAESLPKERRRTAGILRVAAILVILIMIAILAIAPEIINPR